MAIKMIFFDVGGVLSGTHIEKFLTAVAGRFGVSAEGLIGLRQLHHREMVTGKSSVDDFIIILKTKFSISISKDEMLRIWKSTYIECMRLNDELYRFIRSLKGIKVGIISDVYAYHAKINKERGAYAGFDPCAKFIFQSQVKTFFFWH
jgi:FMN phosphatase YigB (HAD superfamily)